MEKKNRIGKWFGTLTLITALMTSSILPVMAEENCPGQEAQVEAVSTEAQANEKEKPSVTVDTITVDGGRLEIPIDLGGYRADEIRVILEKSEENRISFYRSKDMDETRVVFQLYEGGLMEEAVWYARKGSYRATVSFQKGSLEMGFEDVSEYDLTVNILENSKVCKFEEVELEFDGSQDITFYFGNGTNLFEIAAITNLSIFTGMGNEEIKTVDVPDLTEGFSADLAKGILTIDKDALKNALAEGVRRSPGAELPRSIAVNASGLLKNGCEVYNFNRTPLYNDPDYPHAVDITSWRVDISKLDLAIEEEPTVKYEESTGVTVSAADEDVISQSALSFLQSNYAKELANLGENYTVLTRVELTEQKGTAVQEKVKNAVSAIAKDYKIGSYYEISVKADVLSNGQAVEGMTDIAVPVLMKKVSLNIAVPEALKKTGRTFLMYHYQNDKAVKLETKAKDNVLTFETDSFSPYVLTYKDAVGKGTASVPKTGDTGAMPVAVIMLSGVITAMAFCRRGKCQG